MNDATERSWFLQMLAVFGRGFAYAISIWVVFAFIYRPFFAGSPSSDNSADSAKARIQQQEQTRLYEEQTRIAGDQLAESARQQKRMDGLLTKQEEHAKRMDAVMSAWERQSGAKK
jgi:hypothetical protein